MGRLDGKVAIVTGGGTAGGGGVGNGQATAVVFAREGAKVVVVDLSGEAADATVEMIGAEGGEATPFVADVSDDGAVAAMVAACVDAYGRVDVLHNNVGIVELGGPETVTPEAWRRSFMVNVDSVMLTCRHVLPHMVRQSGGSIINISSITSMRNLGPDYIAYPTTKAAVNQFSRIVAAHYGARGVRCNTIMPGFIRTPIVDRMVAAMNPDVDGPEAIEAYYEQRAKVVPLGRMGTPWDIAHAAAFLASDDAAYISGAELVVDGGVVNQLR